MKKLSDERLNVANCISKETLVTKIKESDPVRFDQMLIEEEERKSYYFVKYNSVAIDRKPLTLKFPLFKDLLSDFEQNIENSGGIKILKNEQIVNKVTSKGYTPFNTPKYSNQNLIFDELEIFFENNNVKKTQPLFYLPNETERHTCGTCDGDKYTTCTEHECHGQHTYDCNKCDATGSVDCDDCKGHGEKKCPSCSGTGSIKCKGYVSSRGTSGPVSNAVYSCSNGIATCSNCFGKGCFHCKHKGKTTCPTCNGAGKNPCSKKYNSNYGIGKLFDTIGGMEFCEGSGKIDCKSCNSKGQVRCKKCQGDGRIECKICYGDYTDNRYGKVDCITCETAGELASISYVSTSILTKKDEYILTDGNEIQASDFSMDLIKNHITKEIEPELFYKNINRDFADTHDKYSEFCSNKIQKKIGIQRDSYPKLIKEEMSYECVPCATYSYNHILTATLHDVSILGIDKKQDVLFHSNPTDVSEEKESFKEKVRELCCKAFSTKAYKDKIDRKHEMFLMVHMAKADGVIEEQEKKYLAQTITGLHGFTNKEKGELFGLMSVSTLPMISPLNAYFSSKERAKEAKQKIVELVAKADGEYEPEEKSKLDEINNAIEAGFKAKPSWIGQFFKTWQVSVCLFLMIALLLSSMYFSVFVLPVRNAENLHKNLLLDKLKLEYFLTHDNNNSVPKDTIISIVEAENLLDVLKHDSDLTFMNNGNEVSYKYFWLAQKKKLTKELETYKLVYSENEKIKNKQVNELATATQGDISKEDSDQNIDNLPHSMALYATVITESAPVYAKANNSEIITILSKNQDVQTYEEDGEYIHIFISWDDAQHTIDGFMLKSDLSESVGIDG